MKNNLNTYTKQLFTSTPTSKKIYNSLKNGQLKRIPTFREPYQKELQNINSQDINNCTTLIQSPNIKLVHYFTMH